MMWVLGALGALSGICMGSIFWFVPMAPVIAQLHATLNQDQLNQLGSFDLGQLIRGIYTAVGTISLLISILILVLAGFVRKGNRAATITAVVVFVLLAMGCVLGILFCVIEALTIMPQALIAALLWLAIGSAIGLTLFWLAQSLRIPNGLTQRTAMDFVRLQQQQFPENPGYGYGMPADWPQKALGPLPPPPRRDEPPPPPA